MNKDYIRSLLGLSGIMPFGERNYEFLRRIAGYPNGKRVYKAHEKIPYNGTWAKWFWGNQKVKNFAAWFDLNVYTRIIRFLID